MPETKTPATPDAKAPKPAPATPEAKAPKTPQAKIPATPPSKNPPVPPGKGGAAKGIARFLGKGALKLVPGLGWALLAYDAYSLYEWLAEPANLTPEEAEQRRKEKGLAPGEIPTNENSSVAPNRMKAREQEQKRRQQAAKAAALVNISRGDNPYTKIAPGLIDPVTLQGRINAFNQYGVDRDRQRTSPTERGILPSISPTGAAMTQAAANARMSVMVNNTPVINNVSNNYGGGATSIMTVPVSTADTSDRRDLIRRYGGF